jgi:hypothetical protein
MLEAQLRDEPYLIFGPVVNIAEGADLIQASRDE